MLIVGFRVYGGMVKVRGSVAHTLMRRYGSTATISYKDLIMADLLSSVSTAISLATRLREIGKNIEDAEFKNILADLSLELADSKLKMADLISENAALKEKLAALTSATGELCPKCNNRTFELISTKPHKTMGRLGAMERFYTCSSCSFSEPKLVTP